MGAPVSLDALRERIRVLEGGPRVARRRVPAGYPPLDTALGGIPQPGIVEISGELGSGRLRLLLQVVGRTTHRGGAVAWVDPRARAYPPALADRGVDLHRLLIVRPPEDGSSPWAWATEQLLRSGCFAQVVVDLPPRDGSRRSLAHTWARAAEHGQSTALVVSERPTRELPADVRLSVGGERWYVVRNRGGSTGGSGELPAGSHRW